MTEVIYIIDDDPDVRGAVDSLVRSVGHATELFNSAQAFAEKWLGRKPAGCLILDVRLPGPSGLELQRTLAEARMRLPIIFVTAHGDVPMSVEAMRVGAVDFLTKPFRDQDLLDAIQLALERDRARRRRDSAMQSLLEAYATLGPRERQTLRLVADGQTNKEIADTLGVSEVTAKAARGHLMKKMKATSSVKLMRMALEIERVMAERGP